jgi:NAD(P)-dependent dehydrogenase (short-subunit alcohol dehydrogenase family)
MEEQVAYAVTKAGINALTLHVARKYGKAAVRCNGVAPGLVMTAATEQNPLQGTSRHHY